MQRAVSGLQQSCSLRASQSSSAGGRHSAAGPQLFAAGPSAAYDRGACWLGADVPKRSRHIVDNQPAHESEAVATLRIL